jgi:uncharacterized membrane protein YcgQ (UPF0703/DUF1980 family)
MCFYIMVLSVSFITSKDQTNVDKHILMARFNSSCTVLDSYVAGIKVEGGRQCVSASSQ